MRGLLGVSKFIDTMNAGIGKAVSWLVLLMVLISAGNAVVRKLFSTSSNALLEIQWYLFAAIFLLAAGYTLLRNEHVKIDVVLGRFAKRTQVKVEIFGILVFLLPFVLYVLVLSWPEFMKAYSTGEMSQNAGGLIRWPVYLLLPLGMLLLGLQGVSELIKRLAFLAGLIDDPTRKPLIKTAEEELAEAIRKQSGDKGGVQ
jgi:TRAP-type mannitol/chloroaromatic compound transport system permease small subunit